MFLCIYLYIIDCFFLERDYFYSSFRFCFLFHFYPSLHPSTVSVFILSLLFSSVFVPTGTMSTHWASHVESLQSHLSSAPRRLMVVCGFQILLLFIGVYVGHGAAECEIRLPAGSGIEVDCNRCRL